MHKEIVKRILGCLLLAGTVLGTWLGLSVLFVPKNTTEEYGMEIWRANSILAEPEETVEILIIGDSLPLAAIWPEKLDEVTGMTSYNCASSGQNLCQSMAFLRQAMRSHTLKYVLLETNGMFTRFDWQNEIWTRIEEALPVFRYHNRWKSLRSDDFFTLPEYTIKDPYRGYYPHTVIKSAPDAGSLAVADTEEWYPQLNRQYIHRMSDLCRKDGIELILISSPSVKSWTGSKHASAQNLAEELAVPYYDLHLLQQEYALDWSVDTRDGGDHLNNTGAEKLSRYLGQLICENESRKEL